MAGERIRLLMIEDVPQVASHVRSLLIAQSQIQIVEVIGDGDRALAAVGDFRPDVVIIDWLLQGRVSGAKAASSIRQAHPDVGIIVLTVPQEPITEDPTRGIDAVLRMPLAGFDLTAVIRRVAEERVAQTTGGGAQMVSLFSPKGGVGRTTLAYNLAVALAGEEPVCLVDGSLQFSDLRGLLRAPADARSILDLPTDKIKEGDVSEVMFRDPSGIDVLLAPPRVEMAEMITTRDIEKSLSLLRNLYGHVVIDTRAALTDEVLAFLDASDLVLQILTFDAQAVRALAMANEAFAAIGYPPSKLAVVLNRADASGGMSREEVEEVLGQHIDFEIVSDGRLVLAANNEGVPFVSASPDAQISKGVRSIAAALLAHRRSPAVSVAAR
ncbi:MAG TPA: response regulator [Candidatus Limnocylindria bacterium]|nr:response regulator [Candidatus Limnocylindria bacterium]